MTDLERYYQSLNQEIIAREIANDEGDSQEQTFTKYCLEALSDVGETENASVSYDEKYLGTKNQLKINGYSVSDNYETVDLFITIYEKEENIKKLSKSDVFQAATRITNFFKRSIYGDYEKEIAESSSIFEFVHTLGSYEELKNSLIRVNAFILTNGEYDGDLPSPTEIDGYKIYYRIIDIQYLFHISKESHIPIEIDFEEENIKIPFLAVNEKNDEYQAYIAIMPGICLYNLYERFGSRLLEQNVRAFLQFSGKINKGIRETILHEPHMFFAFNNGIAATADKIEMDESGNYIKKISNLQIVNGGQTTASIYYTHKKDKADLSQIFIQIKISVINKKEQYDSIVSRISRYSNTQNKVNDADFTSNNPFLVEFEKLSRYILTPPSPESPIQTYWFFERARGQYKNMRQKDGFTKSRLKAFDHKYPRQQVITKVNLAKYINSYEEVYVGKKLVIGPHIVVRGNEKNYARFINNNLPDNISQINNVYFEDAIAKAILFKTAYARYGTKSDSYNIGELRQVVVPYTLALLTIITNKRINLYKIWREQRISTALSDMIYDLMRQMNAYILDAAPITHYIEWAKKEECWEKVKNHCFEYDISKINDDLIDLENPPIRRVYTNTEEPSVENKYELGIIKSIPITLWKKISDWGRDSECLNLVYQNAAKEIAQKLKYNHDLSSADIRKAMYIYSTVADNNIELLEEADEISEKDRQQGISNNSESINKDNDLANITIDLVKEMVEWDRHERILEDWKWKAMNDVATGKKELTNRYKLAFKLNLIKLRKHGFSK